MLFQSRPRLLKSLVKTSKTTSHCIFNVLSHDQVYQMTSQCNMWSRVLVKLQMVWFQLSFTTSVWVSSHHSERFFHSQQLFEHNELHKVCKLPADRHTEQHGQIFPSGADRMSNELYDPQVDERHPSLMFLWKNTRLIVSFPVFYLIPISNNFLLFTADQVCVHKKTFCFVEKTASISVMPISPYQLSIDWPQ